MKERRGEHIARLRRKRYRGSVGMKMSWEKRTRERTEGWGILLYIPFVSRTPLYLSILAGLFVCVCISLHVCAPDCSFHFVCKYCSLYKTIVWCIAVCSTIAGNHNVEALTLWLCLALPAWILWKRSWARDWGKVLVGSSACYFTM